MQIEKNDKKETRRSVISPIIAALLIMLSPFACFNMPVKAVSAIEEEMQLAAASLEELKDYIDLAAGGGVADEVIDILGNYGWYFSDALGCLVNGDYDTAADKFRYIGLLSSATGGAAKKLASFTASDDFTNLKYELGMKIRGEEFAAIVDRLNEQYSPAVTATALSWRESSWFCSSWNKSYLPFYFDGSIAGSSGVGGGVYFQPYYYDGTDYYYTMYQLYIYQTLNDDGSISLCCDVYENIDVSTVYASGVSSRNAAEYRYYAFNGLCTDVEAWNNYDAYVSAMQGSSAGFSGIAYPNYQYHKSDDLSVFVSITQGNTLDVFSYKQPSTCGHTKDYGFFLSSTPHEPQKGMYPDIVTENIDPNGLVTLDGDTVYEYIITGSDGSEMIMGDYINNNYTYITNNYGDSESGSDNSTSLPSVPNVQLDLDQYLDGVDDYVATTENFFDKMYKIIPEPIMNTIIISFGLIVVVGVIKIIFFLK